MNSEMRPLIQKASRVVLLGFVMLMMITQFTNCGAYQTPSAADGNSFVACSNASCIDENADNLKIVAHLGDGSYAVPANYTEFNIGGECNEGGFANNTVHWDLIDNTGRIVRDSSKEIQPGINAETKCVNGRFFIYVPLTKIPADNFDRTGLAVPTGGRAAYNLRITIFASSLTSGVQGQASTVVPLTAP